MNRRADVFTLLVDSEFGVLTRITAWIRRTGCNIKSLAVAETAKSEVSRLTICLECRHNTLESVLDRLRRLDCVREVTIFSRETQVARELCLVRSSADLALLEPVCNEIGASLVAHDGRESVWSLCCQPEETEGFLKRLQEIGVSDVARTGTVAIDRNGGKGED